jgi:drug/metabolite transporter (DMT)-like permease
VSARVTGPLVAFGLMALLWGYNWVVMKIGMRFCGPLDFAAMRAGLGVLLLFGVLLVMRVPLAPRQVAKTIWLGLFQTTGFVGLISWSLTAGAAGKSAVLAYTMPFWVILFGWPFLAERVRGWQWLAVGLALSGLVLVLEIWDSSASLTSSVLALAAGASWGVSVILFKRR